MGEAMVGVLRAFSLRGAGRALRSCVVVVSAFISIMAFIAVAIPAPSALAQSCSGDINGDGIVNGVDLSIVLGDWGVCPATIESVTPSQGSSLGGTLITITGTGLAGATSVTVGGVPATNVVSVSAKMVTAVTPAGSVGAVDVSVSGPNGAATASGAFTYTSIVVPSWATLLEAAPDPAVVTDANLRNAILATGLAWRVRDNASQIEMLLVPTGTFTMGCSPSVQHGCIPYEDPVHTVTLTNPFYAGRYEVTQAQWTAKMGSNPSQFQGPSYPDAANRPVETVSWTMIQGFLSATGLRLPTEAEWEYAYRAGTTTAFHSMPQAPNGTNDDTLVANIAWFGTDPGGQTHVVGGKAANGLRLHDIAGNVWEWVNDWFAEVYYTPSPQTNPPGPATGSYRMLRGGSYFGNSSNQRSSIRGYAPPGLAYSNGGFRVARNP